MPTDHNRKRCAVALPAVATVQQHEGPSLKELARQALQQSSQGRRVASVASVAGVAAGAQIGIGAQMKSLAKHMGIPAAIVDSLSADDLAATAEQVALCEGHLDADGNPLARRLLTFYLQTLADQSTTARAS